MIFDFHTHNEGPVSQPIADTLMRQSDGFMTLGDVFAFGKNPDADSVRKINDMSYQYAGADPGRRYAACYINPANDLESCIEEMRLRIVKQGFRAVKFEVDLICTDPAMPPIMQEVARLKVPAVHHCWRKTTRRYPGESFPEDIASLAARHPDVKIVMAHLSNCGYQGIAQAARLPNIYVDTSGGLPEGSVLEYALSILGAERILFGSDIPYRNPASQLGRVLGCLRSRKQRELVLHENAERLLGL